MHLTFRTKDGTLEPFCKEAVEWMNRQDGLVFIREVKKTDIRSNDQNSLMWAWSRDIERHQHEDAGWAHRYNKLRIGVPILRRDSEAFRALYDRLLKPMAYEDKLEAMEIIEVTRGMTVKQMTEFLESVQRHWAKQGLVLESTEDTT